MDNSKRTTERRGSLLILTIIIVIIIIIVIVGICVGVLTTGESRRITLYCLLVILILLGIMSCIFIEFQRKQAIRKRDRSAELWLQQTLEEQRRAIQPSAPPLSAHTSWALTAPWRHSGDKGRKYSREGTLPPYSPQNVNGT
ncbi:hypothetical protein PPYR_05154 [Photinus pyralis]|nr:uncharacterized protein LOC116164979 [Photinus pyralis]KAB0802968.1 hypothetical protein PPYR_05154 [Photinus pyralis]